MSPEGYFELKNISSVELSPDGKEIVFTLHETNLAENRSVESIWRLTTEGREKPVRLTNSEKDYSPKWSPDGKVIAFLSTREDPAQIWTLTLSDSNLKKITNIQEKILSFDWSPNGKTIAFTSQEADTATPQAEGQETTRGIVIQKMYFSVYNLLEKKLIPNKEKRSTLWLLDVASHKVEQIPSDLHVENSSWSPDSETLALTVKTSRKRFNLRSDIAIYSLKDKKIRIILQGEGGEDLDRTKSYEDALDSYPEPPVWSPDGNRLAVFLGEWKDRWSSVSRLGIYSFSDGKLTLITKNEETEFYSPRLFWQKKNELYFEDTFRAANRLFRISEKGGSVQPILSKEGSQSNISFSKDGRKMVFVQQTLNEPPELYFAEFPFTEQKKLSSINNRYYDDVFLPEYEKLQWNSSDGTLCEGWLIKPSGFTEGKTYPLIVFVHGGPTHVFTNSFIPYFSYWPYPFELFASRGYAVFVPNYRGTGSFGKAFREPSDLAKEPSEDILSGVEYLIQKGIADPEKLGIMGQSHGSWLGPYVMAKRKIFKASSFAEGWADEISLYALMPGWTNLQIHDFHNGNPYENLNRYLEHSPIFNFKGLSTATLLEYGELSLSVEGLVFQTALWRQGIPHELIIYPKTGHNISSPVLQLESLIRNLEWFDYWMLERRNPDPLKQEQYERWEQTRLEMDRMR